MARTRKQKRKGGVKYTAANLKLLEESRKRLRGAKPVSHKMRKTIKVRYVPKIQVRKTVRFVKKEDPIIEKFKRVRKFLKELVKRFEDAYESNDAHTLNNYSIVMKILIASLKELTENYSTILDEKFVEKAVNINTFKPDNMIEFVEDFIDEMKEVIKIVEEHEYNSRNETLYDEFMYGVYSEVKELVTKYKDELDKPKNEIVNNVNINNNHNNNNNDNNNNNNNNNNVRMNTKNISGELLAMLSELRL